MLVEPDDHNLDLTQSLGQQRGSGCHRFLRVRFRYRLTCSSWHSWIHMPPIDGINIILAACTLLTVFAVRRRSSSGLQKWGTPSLAPAGVGRPFEYITHHTSTVRRLRLLPWCDLRSVLSQNGRWYHLSAKQSSTNTGSSSIHTDRDQGDEGSEIDPKEGQISPGTVHKMGGTLLSRHFFKFRVNASHLTTRNLLKCSFARVV